MFDQIPLVLASTAPAVEAPPSVSTPHDATQTGAASTQNSGGGGGGGGGGKGNPLGDPVLIMLIFGGILLAWMVFSSRRQQKKERQRRQDMISAIKKGSKVMTTSGIIGVVVETRENEVVLRTDDSTDTRIRFHRDAINTVLDGAESSAPAK